MKYPTPKKLEPLGLELVRDHPRLTLLASGKISNGRKGLRNTTFKNAYELALTLYKDGFIRKVGKGYEWIKNYKGLTYPYVRCS